MRIAALLWVAGFVCAGTLLWDINTDAKPRNIGLQIAKLSDSQKDVEVLSNDSNHWQVLPGGSHLNSGDSIHYRGSEVANFRLRDGRQIKIWPQTLLSVSLVRVGNVPRFRINLMSGRIHATAWQLDAREVDIFVGNEDFSLSVGSDYLDVEKKTETENSVLRYRKNGVIIR